MDTRDSQQQAPPPKAATPTGSDSYTMFAMRLLEPAIQGYAPQLSSVKEDLKKARMRLTIEEYASTSILTVAIAVAATTPFVFLLSLVLRLSLLGVIFAVLIMDLVVAITVVSIFYFYPSFAASGIKKSIDNALPFATIYLSTLAGTGMPTESMFRVLANFSEYGEVSKEAKSIMNDVDVLGMNVIAALDKAAKHTPSDDLRELFWGIKTTITTGGDLRSYLIEKGKNYMASYRRAIDMYVDELSLLTELYITLVVVGSIFFIVMTTIMNMIGASSSFLVMLQNLVVYILLPFTSVGFMVLISVISPTT